MLQAISGHIARILREERVRQDVSMTILGRRAGLSQQMISYVEREMRSPNLDTLLRIAFALDIDPADVLHRACLAARRKRSK
jgi:transcriptional regulator with XRE-family HTH domain